MKFGSILVFLMTLGSNVLLACQPLTERSVQEVIIESDSILVAVALAAGSNENTENEVWFENIEVIKGNEPRQYFKLKGEIVDRNLPNKSLPPYKDRRLAFPGACYSYDYVIGNKYLLMFKQGNPYWAAFRPTNEEVMGMQDPWVMWVSGFVAGVETSAVTDRN